MSVNSTVASVDWTIVGGAIATLIVAIGATLKGLSMGKEKVESKSTDTMTTIVGGTLMDNLTMRDLTEALRANTAAIQEHTHQLERANDLVIMIGHRKDS